MPVIKIRRGTTTQWNASTRVLQVGELGIDTTLNRIKAGNGTNVWSALPYLSLSSTEIEELSQDAVSAALAAGTHSNITVTYSDNGNSISLATGPDVITQTSLSNTLTDATTGYVPIGDVGSADGVASLDSNGKIPDSEIPDTIARDSEIPSNTDSLSEGTTNKYFTDERAQDAIGNAVGTGLSYNDTTGAISVDTSTIATQSYVGTAVSNLVDAAPTTLNTLNELAAALGDDANYASTISTALGLKAPLANPTFTGTVAGVTSTHVGLGNVDNTSDANKPVSTATQTALDLKLNLSEPSVDYYIANSGSGSYTVNGVANGLISFERGKKYRIHINASGHPFWIQTVSGAYSSGNVYSTGITNGGAQVGHIIVELPQNAPDNLYYACEFHSSMQGSIAVDSDKAVTRNTQSSNYTIATIDAGRLIEMSGGGTLTITDSASFPIGFYVDVLQTTTSQVTIAGTSFTPDATPGLKLRARWSSATLIKRSLNSWVVLGDLSA
jgi:hypothetical protein